MADDAPAVAPPGTGAHPVDDDQPDTERTASAAVRDVAASGTALHKGERTSDLELGDAPGATGPGAG
jgi:hypothetical protein